MMSVILVLGIIIIVSTFIVWRWVMGIDYMDKNHANYKGDDLFGKFDDDESEYY